VPPHNLRSQPPNLYPPSLRDGGIEKHNRRVAQNTAFDSSIPAHGRTDMTQHHGHSGHHGQPSSPLTDFTTWPTVPQLHHQLVEWTGFVSRFPKMVELASILVWLPNKLKDLCRGERRASCRRKTCGWSCCKDDVCKNNVIARPGRGRENWYQVSQPVFFLS